MSEGLQDEVFNLLGASEGTIGANSVQTEEAALYQIINGVDYSPEEKAEARKILAIGPDRRAKVAAAQSSRDTQWGGGGAGLQVNPW